MAFTISKPGSRAGVLRQIKSMTVDDKTGKDQKVLSVAQAAVESLMPVLEEKYNGAHVILNGSVHHNKIELTIEIAGTEIHI